MAVTIEASGTQTATLTTEHTLATETDAKVYVLLVDTKNLVNGETLTLRAKLKVLTGSTSALVYEANYIHIQQEIVKTSIPVTSPGFEIIFTLEQNGGTGRAFEWSVVSIG